MSSSLDYCVNFADIHDRRAHIDKSYSPYTFTLNVDRKILSDPATKTFRACRSNKLYARKRRQVYNLPVSGPEGGGSSFVDFGLGVVVRQARGTMMAIRPTRMHGTSIGYGAVNAGFGISFSDRLRVGWEKANGGVLGVRRVKSEEDEENDADAQARMQKRKASMRLKRRYKLS